MPPASPGAGSRSSRQQPWGTPPPQQPWGTPAPGFAPPPGPKKSRTGLIVGGAVVVALGLIGGVYAATSGGGNKQPAALDNSASPPVSASAASSPSASASAEASASATDTSGDSTGSGDVVVPTSADGLKQMTGAAGQTVTDAMKKADSSSSMYDGALFAAYEKSGSKQYFSNLTLVPVSSSSELQVALDSASAKTFIAAVVDQSDLTDVTTETTSMTGGAITCGLDKTSDITLRMCMWADSTEYGLGAYPDSLSNSQAAAYSNALWKASENG